MNTTVDRPSWARPDTDLTGKTVLAIGGAGGVGEGVTRGLLAAGADVIATARSESKLDEFATRFSGERLSTLRLDLTDPGLDATLAKVAAEHGRLDGAVVSVGDWGPQGRRDLVDLKDEEWAYLIENNLTSVFRALRALAPMLAPGGALVHVNGGSAEIAWPGHAVLAMSAAAGKSLTRSLAVETRKSGVRVHDLILGVISTRPKRAAGMDHPAWIPAEEVGVHVAELLAGNSPLTGSVVQYFTSRQLGPTTTVPDLG
jgi:NAD(P)-dependent dehydrogenase (short-subunit alcohol dehydrogenase family)